MAAFYGADLARAHHEGFGDHARQAARVLQAALAEAGLTAGLVVDLGSGSGILARELTEAGYDVVGYDLSADMVSLAREHAPRARFVQASILDVELPPCVAVAAVGEVLNYAADERAGLEHLEGLFRSVAGALCPGGVFLLDVAGPGRGGPTGVREAEVQGDGWLVHYRVQESPDGRSLVREISTTGEPERHLLRLYPPDDVARLLAKAGLDLVRSTSFDTADPPMPGLTGFLARRGRLG